MEGVCELLLYDSLSTKLEVFENKKLWIHDINLDRGKNGEYHTLFHKLRQQEDKFFEYCRMSQKTFDLIHRGIQSLISKCDTNYRRPISTEERLVVTLRFLATGCSFRSLAFTFRMGKTTVSKIVKEVCEAIWEAFQDTYLPYPTEEIWLENSARYASKCDFPNCLGCINEKHIRIKCPSQSRSMYFNYKQYFSINLQAVAGADCKFTMIDVGALGRESDGGIFRGSSFYQQLEMGALNIPQDAKLPNTDVSQPYVFLGDEAYPLLEHLMRPFPRQQLDEKKRIFNYRLSRARRMVECAFGILTAKWRILHKSIETDVNGAILITKGTCILHNIVLTHDGFKGIDSYHTVDGPEVGLIRANERSICNARRNNRYKECKKYKDCIY